MSQDGDDFDPVLSSDFRVVNEELRRRGFSPNVYFDSGQSSLTDDAREQLARNFELLRRYPQLVLLIEGHTDTRGTNEDNIALGERRAIAVRDSLTSSGIAPGNLRTLSYGEERPVSTEEHEVCWQQNRRAFMHVIAHLSS